jgi:S-formylglutathione hydrolase FrmB
MSLDSISLVSGALPVVIPAVGLGALALSFRWKDGVWKRQLLLGVPITGACVGLVALAVDGLALVPYQFPNSYYLWVGLVFLSLIVGAIGWRAFRNWRRAVSVLSVLLTALMAITLINQQYQYYPTLGSVFGVNAENQVSVKQLDALRDRAKRENGGSLPTHGFTITVPIPGKKSGFKARDAYVWLPPIWVANPKIKLPLITLLSGTPGTPSDWTRAGFADRTAREFADAHKGIAPIIVMPDPNGSSEADTECVNSSLGNAETYLTVDVPNYLHKNFNAKTSAGSMAIGGLSEGGMCALMLTLRHPTIYRTFADFSGLTGPTVGNLVDGPLTTQKLFAGSSAQYQAHNPVSLLASNSFPQLGGWFEVGTADSEPLKAQRTLVPRARAAGIETCAREIAGAGHDFDLWSEAFQDSLPWLSYRLGLTTAPPDTAPASCKS